MSKCILREVRFSDWEAVGELKKRNGLTDRWAIDRWIGLWQENPAMPLDQSLPIGWVLEADGNIVGYLGNIPLLYQFAGRSLLAAAARGFAVDKQYRGHSLKLAAAFFSQRNVDLLLNTSANVAAGNVFLLCKAEKIPYPEYDKALFWILDTRKFVEAALLKSGSGRGFASVVSVLFAPIIHVVDKVIHKCSRRNYPSQYKIIVQSPSEIGTEFDDLWMRILAERHSCLLANRSSAVLRWHFGNTAAVSRHAKFVCAWHAGKLMGYAVLTREYSHDIGLKRSRISDMIVEKHAEKELLEVLFQAAHKQAMDDGSSVLEVVGFPENVRKHFMLFQPYIRQLPSWQFWYKADNPHLSDHLKFAERWYATPYDGDASL